MILTCNNLEAMKIWGEIVECLHNKNRYGGNIAEIYAYRLEPFIARARARLDEMSEKEEIEFTHEAAMNLGNILETFIEVYECKIFVEEQKFSTWFNNIKKRKNTYYHRYHIKVKKE